MEEKGTTLSEIENRIYEIRGHKVMLDSDLAALYEVETRILNQAVKRNKDLFPADFMFQLTAREWSRMSSQIVMTYQGKRPKAARPLVFTEHGVAMLANLLKSKKARQTSIAIVRAFIYLRQYALSHKELTEKLKKLEERYDRKFSDVHDAINYLLKKDQQERQQRERRRIGFKEKE